MNPLRPRFLLLAMLALAALVASGCTGWIAPHPDCKGENLDLCLPAQTLLEPIATDSCEGDDRRVCIVPLGQVSPALVTHLVDYYRDEYGLTITVLTPSAIPREFVDFEREQVDTGRLDILVADLFREDFEDSNAVLIALTNVDVYIADKDWRYAFGSRGDAADPKAVISSARMDPRIYGASEDNELFFERVRKLFTKYIGLLYYDLPPSDDPKSPMFNNILGPDDLDRMRDPSPSTRRGSPSAEAALVARRFVPYKRLAHGADAPATIGGGGKWQYRSPAKKSRRMTADGAVLIDVLSESEYAEERIAGAVNIPLKKLDRQAVAHFEKDAPLIVYCYDLQ